MPGLENFPRTAALLQAGIESGLHIGVQLHVRRAGAVACDSAVGEARPGVSLASESLMLWLSSGKPICAAGALMLVEQGLWGLDEPVCRYLPDFAEGGKETITLRHLLTHTGGFRLVPMGWPQRTWDEIIAVICGAPLESNWTPGERAGYHVFSSWYILGALIERISGITVPEFVRQRIFEPLQMHDCWIGMPEAQYERYGTQIAEMPNTDPATRARQPLQRYSSRRGATDCIPGGNAHGPVRELANFYQMLLSQGRFAERQLLRASTVELLTTRQRVGMFDETFKHVMDWSLGLIVNSARYGADTVPYGYGAHASDETFGHSGSQSSTAFADPRHDLVVALAFNGTPGDAAHERRIRRTLTALYEDLGLAAC